jgi:hypothetical protein
MSGQNRSAKSRRIATLSGLLTGNGRQQSLGDKSMKIRTSWAMLGVILAGFATIASQHAIAGGGGEQDGISLPRGGYSLTAQGSLAVCLDPKTFNFESCGTSGALVIPQSAPINGVETFDHQGNSCAAVTEVDTNLPVDASAPFVTPNEHIVSKVLNYDSATGAGDRNFTAYIGGTCHGATFDGAGATEVSSGTDHFVVSDGGKRIDYLVTKLTTSTDFLGGFSLSGTNLRQRSSDS